MMVGMASDGDQPIYDPFTFEFERTFAHDRFFNWIVKNWTVSIWYSLIYVILTFTGKRYMSSRSRFDLRLPLIAWSGLLAVFSICGAVRTIPKMIYMVENYGLEGSVCRPTYFTGHIVIWTCLFAVSKLFELGDTAFIVLRKQPLIFLHWYHHVITFIYVWYSYTDRTAPGGWFMVMNYIVHAFMYTYYALRAMRIRVPNVVKIFITTIQIAQMLMGVVCTVVAYRAKRHGRYCQQSNENLVYCAIMYTSYLVLFAQYFYNAYLKPSNVAIAPVKHQHYRNGESDTNQNGVYLNGSHANGTTKKIL